MTRKSLAASHAFGKCADDKIFGVNKAANERAKIVGKENITNASIGAFLDAKGDLIVLPTVEKTMRSLDFKDVANYAPIAGLAEYHEAVIDAVFREYKPKDAHIKCVATPGGTGGIHHAIYNYTEEGDTYLTADWFWGPYKTMSREMMRKFETYPLFNAEGGFNVEACLESVRNLAKKQKNILLLLNTPAHNPTGYSLTDAEWDELLEGLTEVCESKENNVVLFVDIAYLDFAPPESRKFLEKFTNLIENLLVIVGFSMSKGYTLYGFRTGCMIGISSSEEVAQEFYDINLFSSRCTWSNCTRAGMELLIALNKNEDLWNELEKERTEYRESLEERAETFISEAEEIDLEICPYHSGFFITVPTDDSEAVAKKLQEDNLFVVPLKMGVRIAICAIPKEQISDMAGKIKKALDFVEGDK